MLEPELSFDVLGPVLRDLLTRLEHDINVSTRLSAHFELTPPDAEGRWRVAYLREAGTADGPGWPGTSSWWTRFSDLDHVTRLVVGQTTRWLRSNGVSRWPRCRGCRRHRMRLEEASGEWFWTCPEDGSAVRLGDLEHRARHRHPLESSKV